MSKFHPREFGPHAEYFFGGWRDRGDTTVTFGLTDDGAVDVITTEDIKRRTLDRAWMRHLRRNFHHPEAWVICQAGEGDKAQHVRTREFRHVIIEMEEPYRREMLADWLSRALHRDGNNLRDWYETVGRHHPFAPETRKWVEKKLKELEGD